LFLPAPRGRIGSFYRINSLLSKSKRLFSSMFSGIRCARRYAVSYAVYAKHEWYKVASAAGGP